jgi:polyvinyl alcohol dehydrogenase (cytochrome)
VSGPRRAALGAALLLAAAACGGGDSGDAGSEPAAAQETAAWRHAGYDLGNSRAAAGETAVGPDTAPDLSPRWELADVLGVSGTPVVVDGILYVGDWTGHVRALDAGDGTEVWDHAFGDQPVPGAVALDDERVFAASASGELRALDRASGDEQWTVRVDEDPSAMVYGSPVHVDGRVVVGVASDQELTGEPPTFRGSVVAYDAVSGDEVWRYRTSDAAAGEGPGVGVWSSPAVDEEAGRLYIGTANNTAPPASSRSDSVIALDAGTGEQVWAVQLTAGDVATTGDVGATPNLLTVGGVPAVGVGDKNGVYHVLDRATGAELWAAELTEGSLLGGVTGSAAVAGDTIFVASNRGGTTADLFALGMDDGALRWQVPVGGAVSGSVSWANGVVYVSDSSGRVHGFDARSGDEVWSHELPATAAGGISVVDGMVYAGAGWWFGSETPDMAGGLVAFGL